MNSIQGELAMESTYLSSRLIHLSALLISTLLLLSTNSAVAESNTTQTNLEKSASKAKTATSNITDTKTMMSNSASQEVERTIQRDKQILKIRNKLSQIKININQATRAELQEIKGIGKDKANKIVEYRQKNGHFKTVDDLAQVSGIGKKIIENNRQWLAVE